MSQKFLAAMPKAELHIHIEGSLEPDFLFALAQRNNVPIPYATVDDVRAAYTFTSVQSFLNVYNIGVSVLVTRADFAELMVRYAQRASADGVRHAEVSFNPQAHTSRGISLETVIGGLSDGAKQAKFDLNMSVLLIMSFLRDLPEEDALATLTQAQPYLSSIAGVGLDSTEAGNPPGKFARVFASCKDLGLRCVAHAGELGPASDILDALSLLNVCRIDQGVAAPQDDAVCQRIIQARIPLTVCPLSNVALGIFPSASALNAIEMLRRGVCVTINSDDPAYFGGYILANYTALRQVGMTDKEAGELGKNSFRASWLSEDSKLALCSSIDQLYYETHQSDVSC